MRIVRILSVAVVLVGLMVSGAWAGSITAVNGTPRIVALERMGAATNDTIPGADNNGISFRDAKIPEEFISCFSRNYLVRRQRKCL